MSSTKLSEILGIAVVFFASCATPQAYSGQILTYEFSGIITGVTTNENNVIPGLTLDDVFSGYVQFDSSGWHQTIGTVFATLNGVDLLFEGEYIYGSASVTPSINYSIRVAADRAGFNADIGASSFSAGNFGPNLEDTDGSAGHTELFPASLLLSEFETNTFQIWGTYLPTGDSVNATGQLTEFFLVPEPTSICLLAFIAVFWPSMRVRRIT